MLVPSEEKLLPTQSDELCVASSPTNWHCSLILKDAAKRAFGNTRLLHVVIS